MPFACTAVIDRLRVYVTFFFIIIIILSTNDERQRSQNLSRKPDSERSVFFVSRLIVVRVSPHRMHDIARIGDGVCIGLTRCSSKMLTYAVISVSRVNWTLLMMHNHFNWNSTWSIYQSQSFVSWNMHYNLKQRQKWTPFFVLIFFLVVMSIAPGI